LTAKPATVESGSPAIAERVVLIPLEHCKPSAYNPRTFGPKPSESLVELACSIRRTGQVQPATVRPLEGGVLEIVAGERRWRACRLRAKGEAELTPADAYVADAALGAELVAAGPPVEHLRAVVRELTDAEAQEVCVVENLDREDLQPLEEANGVETLLRLNKGDVEAVAARLSKPVSWVAARVRLLNLTPAWRKALGDEQRGLHTWTTGHLVEVAKLEANAQNSLLDVYRYNASGTSVDDVRRRVRAELRTLGAAPFEILDAALVPKAGACSTCKTTSASTPGLFADEGDEVQPSDLKRARCLNPLCWGEKAIAAAKVKVAELRAAGAGDVAIVYDEYHDQHELPREMQQKARHVGGSYSGFERVKEGTKGAFAGVYAVGKKAGKVEWFKKQAERSSGGGHQKKKGADGEKAVTPLADRRKALNRRRIVFAVQKAAAAVEKSDAVPDDSVLLNLALIFGTKGKFDSLGDYYYDVDRPSSMGGRDRWKDYDNTGKAKTVERSAALWQKQIRPVLISRLNYQGTHTDVAKLLANAKRIGDLVGVNVDALYTQAIADLPEPKSWAKVAADEKSAKKAKAALPPAPAKGKTAKKRKAKR